MQPTQAFDEGDGAGGEGGEVGGGIREEREMKRRRGTGLEVADRRGNPLPVHPRLVWVYLLRARGAPLCLASPFLTLRAFEIELPLE